MKPTYTIEKTWSAAGINKVSALGSANFDLGFALPNIYKTLCGHHQLPGLAKVEVQEGPQETSPDVRMHTETES